MWRSTKHLILTGLHLAGNVRQIRGLPILAYHAIDDAPTPISMPVSLFRQQMEYLSRQGFQSLTLRGAYEASLGGTMPEKPVVLTFDDGFADFARNAVPIMREFGLVATVFVVSGRVGGRGLWRRHPDVPAIPMMSWDTLRDVQTLGMDVQVHTCSHAHLARIEPAEAYREMAEAKSAIEQRLQQPAEFLACPYGDWSTEVIREAKRAGFKGLCPGPFGVERRKPADWFRLKRLGMDHLKGDRRVKMIFFKACMLGTAQWYVNSRDSAVRMLRRRKPAAWETSDARPAEQDE